MREVSRRYGTLIEEKFFAEETPGTRRENQELLAQVLETHQRSA